jgi:ribosomal protein S12 methylthiotransferase accessory factor
MAFPFESEEKIGLTLGVCQFTSNDGESLFVKHNNKLYKISAKSDLDKQSRIFQILKHPKKFSEILNSLSEFKKKDVVDILQTLYKLNLITLQSSRHNYSTKQSVLNNSYLLHDQTLRKNNKPKRGSQVVLIGNGVLAHKLMISLRDMNIKFDRIKSSLIFTRTNKKLTHNNHAGNKSGLESISSPFSPSITSSLNKSNLIIVAEDYHNLLLFEIVNKICFKKRKAWIRISYDDNIGYLGPLVVPGKTSCFNCCELRLVTNSPYYEYELWNNKHNIPETNLEVPAFFADILSLICANEVFRFLTLDKKPETVDNLFVLDTEQINLTKHKVYPHPNCIYCNALARRKVKSDSSSSTMTASISRKTPTTSFLKWSNNSNSQLSDNELLIRLRELIDDKTGIIQEYKKLYETHPLGIYFHHFSMAILSKPLRIGLDGKLTRSVRVEDGVEWTVGKGLSYNEEEIHTLMEAVERYSNRVVDESRLIWSTYNDIKLNAINPLDLVLYSDEQYSRNDIGCSRFSINSAIPWIEGYDLYSGKPVMIPADFVYYPSIREKPLVLDTSNGASAHTDTVQAILNGLFEVIERDSFLTMWLNRFSMPIIDLKKLPFGFTESLRRINEFGMDVKLVDLTNDTGIPVIAAVCYNNNPRGYPALFVGTGSHIDPEIAAQKALFEMESMLSQTLEFPSKEKITSPDKISKFVDHARYYLNPKMRKYWEFMISSKQTSKLSPLVKRASKDNYSMLIELVRKLHTMKHRVIWVDITPSDINRIGLKAVKVFVTGFQPLYLGNKSRVNLERLRRSAEYVSRNIKATRIGSELNSAPHPLP